MRNKNLKFIIPILFFSLIFGLIPIRPEVLAQTSCAGKADYVPATLNEANTYDPCLSSMDNWEPPDRSLSDVSVSGTDGSNSIQLTSSVALAGAIASIKMNGKELISSGGHGSSLNWITHANNKGECYNPTEDGSQADDRNPALRPGATSARFNQPPYHGPSTSYLYYFRNSTDNKAIESATRMAFYVPEGETGYGNCIADYPNVSPYNVNLSPYIVTKTARLGETYPNVITVNTEIAIEQTAFTAEGLSQISNYDGVNIAYLQPDLTQFYKYNTATNSLDPVATTVTNFQRSYFDTVNPLIAASADGNYAVGLYSPKSTQCHESSGDYVQAHSATDPNYQFDFRILQSTFYCTDPILRPANNDAAPLNYKTYWVVGNLQKVKTTLASLLNPSVLIGDLNGDKIVNSIDSSYMNSKWFMADAIADLNHDGIVNALDFSILNVNWFKTIP